MFVEIEAHRLVNLDLVKIVEIDHRRKTVNIWDGGVITVADSATLYRYYSKIELEVVPEEEPVKVAGA